MKQIYSLTFLLALSFYSFNTLQAQITLTENNLPNVGDQLFESNSVDLNFSEGNAGADQTYDFTNLMANQVDTVRYISTIGTVAEADFPDANMVLQGNFGDVLGVSFADLLPGLPDPPATVYFEDDANGHVQLAGLFTNLNLGVVNLGDQLLNPDNGILYYTHLDYGETATSDSEFLLGFDFDSIELTLRLNIDKTINADAYGTITTPLGEFNCIRHHEVLETRPEVGTQLGPIFIPLPGILPDTTIIINSYFYMTDEHKHPVVAIRKANNEIESIRFINEPNNLAQPIAGFTFFNDCLDYTFTNSSSNANTYEWSFGDGNTSNEENPNYTFGAEGEYTVSLTASNAAGTDVIMQDIIVDDCMVAINESDYYSFNIYPIPAQNYLIINQHHADYLKLYNLHGQLIEQTSLSNGINKIDVTHYKNGLINLHFYSKGDFVYREKAIINH